MSNLGLYCNTSDAPENMVHTLEDVAQMKAKCHELFDQDLGTCA